jgi:hypothetical protein
MDNPSTTLARTLAESRKLRKQSDATIAASKAAIEESRRAIEESQRVLDKATRNPK